MGLILLVFALPSVSAISLNISASGWPPCPASTDTSYTITVNVTGFSLFPIFLRIGIFDYIEGRYIARTPPFRVPGGLISVTRTLTIRTPSVFGEISYAADVQRWDRRTRSWVRVNHVDSGIRMSSNALRPFVSFTFGNFNITPSSLTIPSPTRDVTGERNVTILWSLRWNVTRLNISTAAENIIIIPHEDPLICRVQVGERVQRQINGSSSENFTVTHKPQCYKGIFSLYTTYVVDGQYFDWCRAEWVEWTVREGSVGITCDPVTYRPARWNDNVFIMINNNCYNYGADIQTDTFAQPGKGGRGVNYALPDIFSCEDVRNASISDGLIYIGMNRARSCRYQCGHKVALAVMPKGIDYHWYREDNNSGFWSHKVASTRATDRVNIEEIVGRINYNKITNPEDAARFIGYTDFCGYFCVIKPSVNIIGNQTIYIR